MKSSNQQTAISRQHSVFADCRLLIADRCSGFTLIELLLAAVMISVLVVGLGAHLRGGLDVWARVTKDRAHVQRIQVAMEWIQRDFSGAFIYDSQDSAVIAHQFGSDHAQWVSIQVESNQAFPSVRLIDYRCELIEGSGRLVRTNQTIDAFLQNIDPIKKILLDNCERLTFLYAHTGEESLYTLDWQSEWAEEGIPKLMRVIIETKNNEVIERLIMNPSGILTTPGIEES